MGSACSANKNREDSYADQKDGGSSFGDSDQVLRALQCITAQTPDAIVFVRKAMESFPDNADIQIEACRAIASVTDLVPVESLVDVQTERTSTAQILLALMVNAMKKHPDNETLQDVACEALFNLAEHAHLKLQLGTKYDCITAVTQAMKTHPRNLDVQEHGCRLISSLLLQKQNLELVVKGEALECIIKSMRAHPMSPHLQEHGCFSIMLMASMSEELCTRIGAPGVDVVVSALKVHRNNAIVQKQACRALRELSRDADNAQRIVDESAVVALHNAHHAFPENPKLQEAALAALKQISDHGLDTSDVLRARRGSFGGFIT